MRAIRFDQSALHVKFIVHCAFYIISQHRTLRLIVSGMMKRNETQIQNRFEISSEFKSSHSP